MKTNAVLIISLLLFSACSFKDMRFLGVTKVEGEEMKLTSGEINFTFKIDNPNSYGFKLRNSDFNLRIAGSEFRLIGDRKWKLRPGINYLDAKVSFNPLMNIGALTKLLFSKTPIKSLTIDISGRTDAKKFLFKKTFEINESIPLMKNKEEGAKD